jgi:hypothetical protein
MLETKVMIGAAEKRAIKEAIERARISARVLVLAERKAGIARAAEEVLIPTGYHVAVQFEMQSTGVFLHLAIRFERPAEPNMVQPTVPSAQEIRTIANEFGIAFPVEGMVWREHDAVNILVLVEPR